MKWGVIDVVLLNNSRKVGLGFWIFYPMLAVFLFSVLWNSVHPPLVGSVPVGITFDQFMLAVGVAATLIGGGTLMDKHLDIKKTQAGAPNANPPA